MDTDYSKTTEGNEVDLQQMNHNLQEIYLKSKKDFKKRKELRENRLKQINQYRDEQVAALKH